MRKIVGLVLIILSITAHSRYAGVTHAINKETQASEVIDTLKKMVNDKLHDAYKYRNQIDLARAYIFTYLIGLDGTMDITTEKLSFNGSLSARQMYRIPDLAPAIKKYKGNKNRINYLDMALSELGLVSKSHPIEYGEDGQAQLDAAWCMIKTNKIASAKDILNSLINNFKGANEKTTKEQAIKLILPLLNKNSDKEKISSYKQLLKTLNIETKKPTKRSMYRDVIY